ncbi:MAG: transposase [Ignavibacteriae bacterium]|nr:transposase [Ignavibacteriota bacterium]
MDLSLTSSSYLGGIIREEKGALLAAGGVSDHVHLLVRLSQHRAIMDILRVLKTNSSRWVRQTLKIGGFSWQTGYGAFTVSSSNLEKVRRYIARQKEHHRKVTFREEYVRFLEEYGVQYDPKYLMVGSVSPDSRAEEE